MIHKCKTCETLIEGRRVYCDVCKKRRAYLSRKMKEEAYKLCGLKKVRGNLGGIYYE